MINLHTESRNVFHSLIILTFSKNKISKLTQNIKLNRNSRYLTTGLTYEKSSLDPGVSLLPPPMAISKYPSSVRTFAHRSALSCMKKKMYFRKQKQRLDEQFFWSVWVATYNLPLLLLLQRHLALGVKNWVCYLCCASSRSYDAAWRKGSWILEGPCVYSGTALYFIFSLIYIYFFCKRNDYCYSTQDIVAYLCVAVHVENYFHLMQNFKSI